MEEGEMKGEIEDEGMEEEREIRESQQRLLSPLKVPDSIETRLLEWRPQNDGKEWRKKWMEESKKKGEEGLEICEIGENILP